MKQRSKEYFAKKEEALQVNFKTYIPTPEFESAYKDYLIEHPDTTKEEFYHNVYLPF